MRHFFIILVVFGSFCSCQKRDKEIILGSPNAKKYWIYLCGLTDCFNSIPEISNRKILDEIGKNLGIGIIAIPPQKRCSEYQNKLCWPHHTKEEVLETYTNIRQQIPGVNVSGYIGFSNGGFFLLKLAEIKSVEVPLIVIGAGIYPEKTNQKNTIFLLIGKQDKAHYNLAKNYYKKMQENPSSNITLVEYDGGHIIPEKPLEKLLSLRECL
ncbi:MAG: hypothetical protein SNF33_02025 [Candidatus Algichlamydia australiensis]|nr:hypothetical protein [Chlamydiales bacterium]